MTGADVSRETVLAELRQELIAARDAYELCQFIDHYPDVVRCRDREQVRIDALKARIAAIEGKTP